MSDIKPELKPCPFCGAENDRLDFTTTANRKMWCVVCCVCDAEGPIAKSAIAAAENWNRRA